MKHAFVPAATLCIASLLSIGTVSIGTAPSAFAQAAAVTAPAADTAGATDAPNPTLKLSPMKQLEQFEPPADEEYQLGPGDEISLEVPGRPELTGKHVVGPDGRITLPIAGTLQVGNLSRTGAEKAIHDALIPYYTELSVTVGIDKYGSNSIKILGNVQHPGVIYFDGTPTLLDAVARGGLLSTSNDKDGIPERCAIYRGNGEVVWVQLRDLLQKGDRLGNMRLRRNDVIFVPKEQEVFVSVMGEVGHPGPVSLTPQSTLVSVLSQAGGISEPAGNSPNITIVQPSTGKTTVIPYKQLISLNGPELTLHAGDVIVVPKSGFYKATYIIQRLTPITSMMSIAALAGGGI